MEDSPQPRTCAPSRPAQHLRSLCVQLGLRGCEALAPPWSSLRSKKRQWPEPGKGLPGGRSGLRRVGSPQPSTKPCSPALSTEAPTSSTGLRLGGGVAFSGPGGLQQFSYQMTMGDSDRAGSDLHTLCIHLHTPRCQPGPHLLLILLQGGEEGGSSCPLEKRERLGSRRTGLLPGPRRAGPAPLRSGIPRKICQWAGELCLSLGVGEI